MLGLSRLVPRKGFDIVIDAVAAMPDVQLAIAGGGRDRKRLETRAGEHANIHFLGRVPEDDLAAVHACADVFAMCCRDRWAGLEAEGLRHRVRRGRARAVFPRSPVAVAARTKRSSTAKPDSSSNREPSPRCAIESGPSAPTRKRTDRMGHAARTRAETVFTYDRLVATLTPLARGDVSAAGMLPR